MEFHGDCWENLAGGSCCEDTELKARSAEGGEIGAVVLQSCGAFKFGMIEQSIGMRGAL